MNQNEPVYESNEQSIKQLQLAVIQNSKRIKDLKEELDELRHIVATLEMKREQTSFYTLEELENS